MVAPAMRASLPEPARAALGRLRIFGNLLSTEPAVLALPYELRIR